MMVDLVCTESRHFSGPSESRRVINPFCLGLLVIFWGLMSWIGVWAMQSGNLDVLIYPFNYKGRLCGIDEDLNGALLPPLVALRRCSIERGVH